MQTTGGRLEVNNTDRCRQIVSEVASPAIAPSRLSRDDFVAVDLRRISVSKETIRQSIAPSEDPELIVVQPRHFTRQVGAQKRKIWWKRIYKFAYKHVNFYRFHFIYFCLCSLLGGALVYGIEGRQYDFLDCLLTSTSAMCVCGLMGLNVPYISLGSQFVLIVLNILGSNIVMSLVPVFVRRLYIQHHVRTKTGNPNPINVLVGENRLEYKATGKLLWVGTIYFAGVQLLGYLLLVIYCSAKPSVAPILEKRRTSASWFSMFYTIQAFANCGWGSIVDFNTEPYVLVVMSLLIALGNVFFPIAFRFVIYFIHYFSRKKKAWRFILDHPRRVFTTLFDNLQTAWLVIILALFTLGEAIVFLVLDWNAKATDGLSAGDKVANAWFSAVSTRTAGFNSIDMQTIHPASLMTWMLLMYISAYPVTLSMRASNYNKTKNEENLVYKTKKAEFKRSIAYQARHFFFRDETFLILAAIVLCITQDYDISVSGKESIFAIMFEVVSAYGTVGLSMGYDNEAESLSKFFHPLGKILISIIMLLGRHRLIPDSIDHAVQWQMDLPEKYDTKKGKKTLMRAIVVDVCEDQVSEGLADSSSHAEEDKTFRRRLRAYSL